MKTQLECVWLSQCETETICCRDFELVDGVNVNPYVSALLEWTILYKTVLALQLYVQSETTHPSMDDLWRKAIVKYIDMCACVSVSVSVPAPPDSFRPRCLCFFPAPF